MLVENISNASLICLFMIDLSLFVAKRIRCNEIADRGNNTYAAGGPGRPGVSKPGAAKTFTVRSWDP